METTLVVGNLRMDLLSHKVTRSGKAVALLGRVQDAWAMLNALSHLADAAALRSDASRAAQLYGAAETLIERTGASTFPVWAGTSQRCRSMALAALGQQRFDELRSQGRTMSLDQVVAVAAG